MKLWTVQPVSRYERLCKDGIIYGEKEHIEWINEEMFNNAYIWMLIEMQNRIGIGEKTDGYPIWAWYQYNTVKQRRPDLRGSGFLEKGIKIIGI